MRQFLSGSDADFLALENRAQGKCIRFKEQEMPPGAVPEKASIGVEVDGATDKASILVANGVNWNGESSSLRDWFSQGKLEFPSFDALKVWIRNELAPNYGYPQQDIPRQNNTTSPTPRRAEDLTNLPAVNELLPDKEQSVYLDRESIGDSLSRFVKGQEDAVQSLAKVVARHCARKNPTRPAVLFSVGPSGVGKTRAAESLVEVINNLTEDSNHYRFLRLDMNEYQEAHRVSQLIGAPQGYVGHEGGSQLLDFIKANSHNIILFDEIEKAHSAILRVLMSAMDAGRLSSANSSSGSHEVDCRHSIFMFTSNLDANEIISELQSRSGFSKTEVVDEVCRRRMKASGIAPEIIGRIGRFLVFKPLGTSERVEIMALLIAEVAEEYGLTVNHIAPEVIVAFMQKTGSGDFGVRPAKFLIDEELGDAFMRAAQAGLNDVEILGPPYVCTVCRQNILDS